MKRLTLRDKHILREMLMYACSFKGSRASVFENTLAKVVPKGSLPKLRERKK